MWRVRLINVAVEMQQCVSSIIYIYLLQMGFNTVALVGK